MTTACGSSSGGAPEAVPSDKITITWQSTGGEAQKQEAQALQEPFTVKTGVKFNNVTSLSYISQVQTMVKSGKTVWDVVHTGSYLAKAYCGTLFEKIDMARMPATLVPEGTTTECSVPGTKFATEFAYDTTAYKDTVPTRIADFFDTGTFPGKRVFYNNPKGILEAALVADGVAPERLYPLDVDRALGKLGTIKSDIIFAPSYTAFQQNLVDKQATMALGLNGRLHITNDSGGTMAPVWDFTSWDYTAWLIPKGAPNAKAAEEAVAFALEPEQLVKFCAMNGLTPVRTDIDPNTIPFAETAKVFNPFLGSDRGRQARQDNTYWAENVAEVTRKWTAWQVG
ncbi:extracellular solute-binding protein [Phytohabitans sp. ZYX-F-186]|uniref:Extracellular solute-binding protein n=1 Tax=Phytohabitans maris TaxID=3071409 RepID=A0ABU0ZKD0_9ACTN|nr:extracellular solute-binding protein [Phytohabitans sp. ZYX-F-186]MDQ7907511.1 extracellular solute-binding protein [Phytohabitans sp. ZYX-F-186]